VLADEKRLVQAVTNLLNNAAKYTPPEGHIRVETVVEGQQRRPSTCATTESASKPEMTERVFDLFAQAEAQPGSVVGRAGARPGARKELDRAARRLGCLQERGRGQGERVHPSVCR
jgi:signal transduction histidine kinase